MHQVMSIKGVIIDKNKTEDKSFKAVAIKCPNNMLRYCGVYDKVIAVYLGEQIQLKR